MIENCLSRFLYEILFKCTCIIEKYEYLNLNDDYDMNYSIKQSGSNIFIDSRKNSCFVWCFRKHMNKDKLKIKIEGFVFSKSLYIKNMHNDNWIDNELCDLKSCIGFSGETCLNCSKKMKFYVVSFGLGRNTYTFCDHSLDFFEKLIKFYII